MRTRAMVAILVATGMLVASTSVGEQAVGRRTDAMSGAGGEEDSRSGAQTTPATRVEQDLPLDEFISIVSLIATVQENAEWSTAGTTEEKQAFIARFWEVRDPTPGTEANEFRDLYMRRVDAANRKFRDESVPGYQTDRGQFILIYGEDAILEQERRRIHDEPEGTGATAAEGVPRYRVTWIVDSSINPYLEGRDQFAFELSAGRYSWADENPPLSQEALLAHRDLSALFGLLRAGSLASPAGPASAAPPGGTPGAPGATDAAEPRLSMAGEAMRQLIDEGVERSELGLRYEISYFPAPDSNTYTVIAFKVGKEGLTFGGEGTAASGGTGQAAGDVGGVAAAEALEPVPPGGAAVASEESLLPAPAHLFGFLLQESDAGPEQLLRQLVIPFEIDPAAGTEDSSRTHSFAMTLVPGSYRLAWGVMDTTSERLTTESTPFHVPNFGTGELTMTSVLVATPPMRQQMEAIDIDQVYGGVRIGNVQLDVDIDRNFERDATLELLYFVMGAGIDPISQQPQLEVEHSLLRGDSDEAIARLPTQTLNYFSIGQQIPLGQIGQIEPGGSYRVLIKVKDVVTESELAYEVPFTIVGETPAR